MLKKILTLILFFSISVFAGGSQQNRSFMLQEMRFFKEGIIRLEFNNVVKKAQLKKQLHIYKKITLPKQSFTIH